jgi:hypothetical protein
MPLPAPATSRSLTHRRRIQFEGYKRADGLYDIEAHLYDAKPTDYTLSTGLRPAGTPIHDMWIRLTLDGAYNIVEASARTEAMPYPGVCERITLDYRKLVGLNLLRGFRKAVHDLFAHVKGCTHLNEMLLQFPSAAIQARAGEKIDNADDPGGKQPFQLDQCHALDTRGEIAQRYYPKWYRGAKAAGAE